MGRTTGSDANAIAELCSFECYVIIVVLLSTFAFHIVVVGCVAGYVSWTDSQQFVQFRVWWHDCLTSIFPRLLAPSSKLTLLRDVSDHSFSATTSHHRFLYFNQIFPPQPACPILESILPTSRLADFPSAQRVEDVDVRIHRLRCNAIERSIRFCRPLFPGELFAVQLDTSVPFLFCVGLGASHHPSFSVPGRAKYSFGVDVSKRRVLLHSQEIPFATKVIPRSTRPSHLVVVWPSSVQDPSHRIHVFLGAALPTSSLTAVQQRSQHLVRSLGNPYLVYERIAILQVGRDLLGVTQYDEESTPGSDYPLTAAPATGATGTGAGEGEHDGSIGDDHVWGGLSKETMPALYPVIGFYQKDHIARIQFIMGSVAEPFASVPYRVLL